jgi:hypothetical protein
MERELVEPVDIALADGRLRREAVGWSRHPIQRCNLPASLSRVHRWNHWCLTAEEHALTITVADVGLLGLCIVSFLEFAARAPVERVYVRPLGLPTAMPDTPRGDLVLEAPRLSLSMRERDGALHIDGGARTLFGKRIALELVVERPRAHETLNVLVPFSDDRFQFTSKQQALPVRGEVRIDSRAHRFGPDNQSFACLDFGRGRWPDRIAWNWAFASGRSGGRTIGLNFGGQWTDGSGVTENGFVVDGRLHKVHDDVDFQYDKRAYQNEWRIRSRRSARVDLRFQPLRERAVKLPLGIASAELHQLVGRFSGTLVDDENQPLRIENTLGLAESFVGRW